MRLQITFSLVVSLDKPGNSLEEAKMQIPLFSYVYSSIEFFFSKLLLYAKCIASFAAL